MSDAIRAAFISGGIQLTTGLLTLVVAVSALNSWRRNALGARQIQLAEECLQSVWKLDAKIKSARSALAPGNIEELKNSDNPKIRENYNVKYRRALFEINDCRASLKNLNQQLMLAEFYLGDLPKTRLLHTARFFEKIPYSLYQEYDEIIPGLLICLEDISIDKIDNVELTQKYIKNFNKQANIFYGFLYEYEGDDYSVRLRISRVVFERHIKRVLKRQGLFDRLLEKVIYSAEDNYWYRFKPVTFNKFPHRKWLDDSKNNMIK